tara:strand:- start:379 stop:597 length:219 start_codon:yes stop_codon:yes gene_type:complete
MMIIRRVPVFTPLPYIATDIVDSVTISLKCGHWRSCSITILSSIVIRKRTLPNIAEMLAIRLKTVPPGETLA